VRSPVLAILVLFLTPLTGGGGKRALAGAPEAPPSSPTVNTLLVAGAPGIQEVDLAGKVVRTVGQPVTGPARFLSKREGVLFLGADGDLWVTKLADGSTGRVAKLPKKFKSCEEIPDYPPGHRFPRDELDIQEESDFTVDQGGELACLALSDRNDNMANFTVQLVVNLKTGKVRTFGTGCKGVEPRAPRCQATDWLRFAPAPVDRAKFPFGLAKGRLQSRGPDGKKTRLAKLGAGDFQEDQVSPTGTWMTIKGNEEEGDAFHFDLFLLNRADGRVWPVGRTGLAPLTVKQLATLHQGKVETETVVGETSIRWIPGHDRLLVDGRLLVTPGVGAIELPGTVVF
jgi:hypothetical protein